jgi:cobalt/nickel transport system ATP-binding protein
MIELDRVAYAYADVGALEGVSLRIGCGESVAVLGPNGSGKSTLLKLINGLVFPSRGSYRFDGAEVTRAAMADDRAAKSFHRRVGFLFQDSDAMLFCPTVFDEIAFGPRQTGLPEPEVEERSRDLMALLGIEALESRSPYLLSGGEKRKVALAAVLSLNPEVLCLDEPTASLDPKSKRLFIEILKSLNASGKTLICATHDFDYVDGLFSRAAVLSESHGVARDGPYREIASDRRFLEQANIV